MSRGLSQVLCEDNVKYVQQNEVISTTRGNFDLGGVFFHRRFAKRTCCIELTANRKQLTVLCQDERCLGVHCPENNLNIRIKTDHVTCNGMSGFWARYMQIKAGHIELQSAPDGLYGPRFRLFLAQCAPHYAQRDNIFNVYHVSLIILIYSRAELRPTFWLIIFFWGGVALSHGIFYIQYCYGHEKSL